MRQLDARQSWFGLDICLLPPGSQFFDSSDEIRLALLVLSLVCPVKFRQASFELAIGPCYVRMRPQVVAKGEVAIHSFVPDLINVEVHPRRRQVGRTDKVASAREPVLAPRRESTSEQSVTFFIRVRQAFNLDKKVHHRFYPFDHGKRSTSNVVDGDDACAERLPYLA
jgi:hypothetical protein